VLNAVVFNNRCFIHAMPQRPKTSCMAFLTAACFQVSSGKKSLAPLGLYMVIQPGDLSQNALIVCAGKMAYSCKRRSVCRSSKGILAGAGNHSAGL